MVDIQPGIDALVAAKAVLVEVKSKLDVIATLVAELRAGSLPQAQVDALNVAVADVSSSISAISSEEDTINPPVVPGDGA